MLLARRSLGLVVALAIGVSAPAFGSGVAHADPTSADAATAAVTWLKTQQRTDGSFEVADFPGFETRDAVLAIAEAAQTGSTWDAPAALKAVRAVKRRGNDAAERAGRPGGRPDLGRRRGQARAARPRPARLGSDPLRSRVRRRLGPQPRGPDQVGRDLRKLRRVQRHAVCGARARARHRLGAGDHDDVHPGRAAGRRGLELLRRRREPAARHRHERPRDPRAAGEWRSEHGSRRRGRPGVPRGAAPGGRQLAVVRRR